MILSNEIFPYAKHRALRHILHKKNSDTPEYMDFLPSKDTKLKIRDTRRIAISQHNCTIRLSSWNQNHTGSGMHKTDNTIILGQTILLNTLVETPNINSGTWYMTIKDICMLRSVGAVSSPSYPYSKRRSWTVVHHLPMHSLKPTPILIHANHSLPPWARRVSHCIDSTYVPSGHGISHWCLSCPNS